MPSAPRPEIPLASSPSSELVDLESFLDTDGLWIAAPDGRTIIRTEDTIQTALSYTTEVAGEPEVQRPGLYVEIYHNGELTIHFPLLLMDTAWEQTAGSTQEYATGTLYVSPFHKTLGFDHDSAGLVISVNGDPLFFIPCSMTQVQLENMFRNPYQVPFSFGYYNSLTMPDAEES